MRKLINKVLSLLLMLSLYGCTVDNQPIPIESLKRSVRHVSSDDIPEVIGKLDESLNLLSNQHKSIRGGQVSTPWGEIDLNDILEVVDTLQNTNYTFSVFDDDGNPFTFTNLIVKKRESGEIDTPFLLEYRPDSSYIDQFIINGFSIRDFTGMVSKKALIKKDSRSQGSTANLEDSRSNINDCSEDTYFSGGSNSNVISNPTGGGLTGLSISTGCYAVVYHIDEVIPPGPKYRPEENYWSSLFSGEDLVVWICNDTYSFDIDEGNNCPPSETEDIGVLYEGFEEFLSTLTLHQDYYGPGGVKAHLNKLWQEGLINAHLAGFLTGMYEMVEDTWSSVEFLTALSNGLNATASQQAIKAETWQFVMLLNRLVLDSTFRNQVWDTLESQFRDYIIETVNIDKQAQFNQGKILFDVVTLFIGVGEIKAILKGQQLAIGILNTLSKLEKALAIPLVQAKRLGMKTLKSGDQIFIKSANGVDDVARVSYNKMRISKHQIEAKDGSVVFKEASEVNTYVRQFGYTDPPFKGPSTEFITEKTERFVRFHNTGNRFGPWIMKESDIKALTENQIRDLFAIPSSSSIPLVSFVEIPAGKKLINGKANNLFSSKGGGSQFFIDRGQFSDTFVPLDWFKGDAILISDFLNN